MNMLMEHLIRCVYTNRRISVQKEWIPCRKKELNVGHLKKTHHLNIQNCLLRYNFHRDDPFCVHSFYARVCLNCLVSHSFSSFDLFRSASFQVQVMFVYVNIVFFPLSEKCCIHSITILGYHCELLKLYALCLLTFLSLSTRLN